MTQKHWSLLNEQLIGVDIAIRIAIGVGLGAATDNMETWVGLGVALRVL